jgi:hypothetical protein
VGTKSFNNKKRESSAKTWAKYFKERCNSVEMQKNQRAIYTMCSLHKVTIIKKLQSNWKGFVTISIKSIYMDELMNYKHFCQRYYCRQQVNQPTSVVAPLPTVRNMKFPKTSGKKRQLSDKDQQEMKFRRMLRNRESAARSRSRKLVCLQVSSFIFILVRFCLIDE